MNPFNHFCHRKPERSFFYKNHQFPVCARCTGFYISIFTYAIVAMYIPMLYSIETTIIAISLLIPSAIDGFTQFFELRESNNYLRLITGLLGGVGLIILFKTLKFIFIN